MHSCRHSCHRPSFSTAMVSDNPASMTLPSRAIRLHLQVFQRQCHQHEFGHDRASNLSVCGHGKTYPKGPCASETPLLPCLISATAEPNKTIMYSSLFSFCIISLFFPSRLQLRSCLMLTEGTEGTFLPANNTTTIKCEYTCKVAPRN